MTTCDILVSNYPILSRRRGHRGRLLKRHKFPNWQDTGTSALTVSVPAYKDLPKWARKYKFIHPIWSITHA